MSYKSKNKDFAKKYDKEIRGIAKKNNVDMGVARDMFEANIRNSRTGSDKVYGGGGKVDDDSWAEMGRDYDDLIKAAKEKGSRRRTVNYPKTSVSSSSGSHRSNRSSSRESTGNGYIDEIKRLAELQKQQAIAGLRKSRDTALSNLNSEKADIQPRYYAARNDANKQSKLGAKSFAEYMANRGLANSGENTQVRLMQNVALQGQIGALKQQEQQEFDEIGRRITDVNNAYASDIQSVKAGIDAKTMQNLITEHQRLDNIKREEAIYQAQLEESNRRYEDQRSDIEYNRNYRENRDRITDKRYLEELEWQSNTNNPINQARILQNKIAEFNLANMPKIQQLELTKLQKQINQIGRTPYRTPEQIEMSKIQLEIAREKLNQLRSSTPENKVDKNTILAGAYNMLDQGIVDGDITNASNWLKNNRTNIIRDLGITEYNRMYRYLEDTALRLQ